MSFYNGTNKKNIYPTPVIGGVGLIREITNPINHLFKKENSLILLIGKTFGHLSQSALFHEVYSINEGPPPDVNLINEKNNGEIILSLINKKIINSAHDVSSGGVIMSLAEMSMSSGMGVKIEKPKKLSSLFEYFFGEDQGRYVVEIDKDKLSLMQNLLKENNVFSEIIGITQKNKFEINDVMKVDIKELCDINNKWYHNY